MYAIILIILNLSTGTDTCIDFESAAGLVSLIGVCRLLLHKDNHDKFVALNDLSVTGNFTHLIVSHSRWVPGCLALIIWASLLNKSWYTRNKSHLFSFCHSQCSSFV